MEGRAAAQASANCTAPAIPATHDDAAFQSWKAARSLPAVCRPPRRRRRPRPTKPAVAPRWPPSRRCSEPVRSGRSSRARRSALAMSSTPACGRCSRPRRSPTRSATNAIRIERTGNAHTAASIGADLAGGAATLGLASPALRAAGAGVEAVIGTGRLARLTKLLGGGASVGSVAGAGSAEGGSRIDSPAPKRARWLAQRRLAGSRSAERSCRRSRPRCSTRVDCERRRPRSRQSPMRRSRPSGCSGSRGRLASGRSRIARTRW
jgi:hypothetical protein